jgi:hypothetical protein
LYSQPAEKVDGLLWHVGTVRLEQPE